MNPAISRHQATFASGRHKARRAMPDYRMPRTSNSDADEFNNRQATRLVQIRKPSQLVSPLEETRLTNVGRHRYQINQAFILVCSAVIGLMIGFGIALYL